MLLPHHTLLDPRACFSFIGLTAVCRRKKNLIQSSFHILLTIKRNCWTETKIIKTTTLIQNKPISSASWLSTHQDRIVICLFKHFLSIWLKWLIIFHLPFFNSLVAVSAVRAVSIQLFLFLIAYRMHNIHGLQIHILQLTDLLLLSFVDAVDYYLLFHSPTFG